MQLADMMQLGEARSLTQSLSQTLLPMRHALHERNTKLTIVAHESAR